MTPAHHVQKSSGAPSPLAGEGWDGGERTSVSPRLGRAGVRHTHRHELED